VPERGNPETIVIIIAFQEAKIAAAHPLLGPVKNREPSIIVELIHWAKLWSRKIKIMIQEKIIENRETERFTPGRTALAANVFIFSRCRRSGTLVL
jgi:hypothetical protein